MSYQSRALTSNLRHPSIGGSQNSTGQSPVLVARINEKRAELESLKQLRDLSAGLAEQMQSLEQKLATLSDGTEGTLAVSFCWSEVPLCTAVLLLLLVAIQCFFPVRVGLSLFLQSA